MKYLNKLRDLLSKLKCAWQHISGQNTDLGTWILQLRPSYICLHLHTLGTIYEQEQRLKMLALQQAVLIRPTRPFYREDDQQIIAEYEELAAADPLNFNTEQMYEDLIAERQLAELLEAQAGMNEWWLIALPEERQAWLEKARRLQQQQKGSLI